MMLLNNTSKPIAIFLKKDFYDVLVAKATITWQPDLLTDSLYEPMSDASSVSSETIDSFVAKVCTLVELGANIEKPVI